MRTNSNESAVSMSGFLFVNRSLNHFKDASFLERRHRGSIGRLTFIDLCVRPLDDLRLVCPPRPGRAGADTGDSALESTDRRDKLPQLNGDKIREGGRSTPTKRVQLQGKENKSAAAAWTA